MKTLKLLPIGAVATATVALLLIQAPGNAEAVRLVPPPALDLSSGGGTATAVFAGGCFWGVEGVFERVAGVTNVVSGYAGGKAATAHYDLIGTGLTGHAEAVRITYDPAKITYGQLLRIYFSVAHDPTELNRQGPDTGPQYRSTVFAATSGQAKIAAAYIAQLDRAKVFPAKLATTIEAGRAFYPAEAYHQDFLTKNPRHPYIVAHDLPKVAALKRLFPAVYRG